MAIIYCLHGVNISIMAGDTLLKEYKNRDEEEPDHRTLTRYIEAKSNQEFRIEVKVEQGSIVKKSPGNCLGFHVYVDGYKSDQFIVTRKDVSQSAYLTESLGLDQPDGMVQKYRFSNLETVEDDIMTGSTSDLKHLGTIRVEAHWKHNLGAAKRLEKHKEFSAVSAVSEKALKGQAISHAVSLAPPTKVSEEHIRLRTEYVNPDHQPTATFVFRYRSLAALESMLIIPRAPTPNITLPLEERDPSTLTPAEQLQVIKILQAETRAHKEATERQAAQQEAAHADTSANVKRKQCDAGDDVPPRKRLALTQPGGSQIKVEENSNRRPLSASLGRRKPEIIEID